MVGYMKVNSMDIWADLNKTVTAIDENDVLMPRAVLKATQESDCHEVLTAALWTPMAVAGERSNIINDFPEIYIWTAPVENIVLFKSTGAVWTMFGDHVARVAWKSRVISTVHGKIFVVEGDLQIIEVWDIQLLRWHELYLMDSVSSHRTLFSVWMQSGICSYIKIRYVWCHSLALLPYPSRGRLVYGERCLAIDENLNRSTWLRMWGLNSRDVESWIVSISLQSILLRQNIIFCYT